MVSLLNGREEGGEIPPLILTFEVLKLMNTLHRTTKRPKVHLPKGRGARAKFDRAREALNRAFSDIAHLTPEQRTLFLNRYCYRIFASFYTKHMVLHHQILARALNLNTDLINGTTFLDVAGGTGSQYFINTDSRGTPLTALATHLRENGIELTFNDLSSKMIEHARKTFKGSGIRTTFTDWDIRELPKRLRGKTFDTVLFSYAIHGIPDPKFSAMRAIVECLSPGGVLFDAHEKRARIVTNPQGILTGDMALVSMLLEGFEVELSPVESKAIYVEELGLKMIGEHTEAIDATPHHELVTRVYRKQ